MSTEIAPLQAVQDQIKDRIKSEFVSLIPDEAWAAMVQSVIKDFTSPIKSYNSNPDKPSPMAQLILDEVTAIAKTKVVAELNRLDQGAWDHFGQKTASEAVIKLVTEHMPTIMGSIQSSMANMLVMNAVAKIRNGGY